MSQNMRVFSPFCLQCRSQIAVRQQPIAIKPFSIFEPVVNRDLVGVWSGDLLARLLAVSAIFLIWHGGAVLAQTQSSTPLPTGADVSAPTLTGPSPEAPSLGAPSLSAPSLATPTLTTPIETAPVVDTDAASPAGEGVLAVEADSVVKSDAAEETALAPAEAQDLAGQAEAAFDTAYTFLKEGGPSIWAIASLAVITLALILWKNWRLALMGAWSKGKAWRAVAAFEAGAHDVAAKTVNRRRGVRSKVVVAAVAALMQLPEQKAREEVSGVAKNELAKARVGLGALELISTIAPLLGLLGTVLGMIAAFQALQAAGSKADPALLAGGIWEALSTAAAGMAVAIPASAALTWFESVIERIRGDVEDSAARLFVVAEPEPELRLAAE